MNKMPRFFLFPLFPALLATACEMVDMPVFDTPFVYIATSAGADNAIVGSDVDNVNTYFIYLSSESLTEELKVDFSVTAGSGLTAGIDYELLAAGGTVSFLPGIYRVPVRIRWKPREVEDAADNTLVIRLTGNSKDFTLGFPGPDATFSKLTLKKMNL